MTTPRVSVGLPLYNAEPFLRSCLDSLLSQTFSDFELIISDNASTDDTGPICRAYAAHDTRIRYSRNSQNVGIIANFNRVFELSRGEYFRWAASDDLCAPELLERLVACLDHHPRLVLCYAKTRLIDEQNQVIGEYEDHMNLPSIEPSSRFLKALYELRMVNLTYGLSRSRYIRMTPLFGNYPSSDLVYIAHLALLGPFEEIDQPLFFRRTHAEMTMQKYPSPHERAIWMDPSLQGRRIFPSWRFLFGYLSAINSAPIPIAEKLRCLLHMRHWMDRWGSGLWEDIRLAVHRRGAHHPAE